MITSRRVAFTLVELLIALSIIMGLLTMISGIYQIPISRAQRDVLVANLRVMRRGLHEFYNDHGRYPFNGQDSAGNMVTFLDNRSSELVQGVHDGLGTFPTRRTRYLVAIPPDPTLTDPTPIWNLVPFDNDGDWKVQTDDLGADGVAHTNDAGEDGEPSAGEPHVDEDPFGNGDEDGDGKTDEDPPDVKNVRSTNRAYWEL